MASTFFFFIPPPALDYQEVSQLSVLSVWAQRLAGVPFPCFPRQVYLSMEGVSAQDTLDAAKSSSLPYSSSLSLQCLNQLYSIGTDYSSHHLRINFRQSHLVKCSISPHFSTPFGHIGVTTNAVLISEGVMQRFNGPQT